MGLDSADGVTELPVQPIGSAGTPRIVGTPLPTADAQVWTPYGLNHPFVEELDGSPRAERAEQCTCEHRLKMDKASAIFYFTQMPRGLVVTDTGANIWRVLSCEYERTNDLYTTFHYVMESLSFDSPPDDFSNESVSLDVNIIKHPRYWRFLCPYQSDSESLLTVNDIQVSIAEIKEAIIRMVQNYIESPFYPSQAQTNSLIQLNIINAIQSGTFQLHYNNAAFNPAIAIVDPVVWDGKNDDIPTENCAYFLIPVTAQTYIDDDPETGPIHLALAASQELISKLWRQEDTPYLVGRRLRWRQYFFAPVYLNPGGYLENPMLWIPSYFTNPLVNFGTLPLPPRGDPNSIGQLTDPSVTGQDPGANADTGIASLGATILDWMILYNPQSYSSDGTTNGTLTISSLRLSDDVVYERTWEAVDHIWDVAPIGKWDNQIYLELGQAGPQVASDFNTNPIDFSDN